MAMTEHSDLEPAPMTDLPRASGACRAERGACRVHGAQFASMQASHAAEVSALRRRIETLEASLAQSEAARAAQARVADQPPVTSIDIHSTDRRKTDRVSDVSDQLAAHASNITTGAAAWDDDEATFNERIAALAFFRDDDSDQPARRWFLRNS